MNDQNLVLWAIDENMGTNLQAFLHRLFENTKTAITFCKNIFFFFLNNFFVNRAGRKPVRAGRSALRNRPSWNTGSDINQKSTMINEIGFASATAVNSL